MGLFIAIDAALLVAMLIASSLVLRAMVSRAEDECLGLLRSRLEEDGMMLLRCHRCGFFPLPESPSLVCVINRASVEDAGSRVRTAWACVIGRTTGDRRFLPREVEVHYRIEAPRFRLRTLMALVLYAALDFAALHAAQASGSLLGLGAFILLTLIAPIGTFIRWRTRQRRTSPLPEL